jgi:hypothetical protein
MLKSIDILIGFSVIMLAVSMSVTLIIQWILQMTQMRGRKLEEGIAVLLRQVDPELLTPVVAKQIAHRILTHPMLARSGRRMAEVVEREELIKIVLEIAECGKSGPQVAAAAAAGTGGVNPTAAASGMEQTADPLAAVLAKALANSGIANPGPTLDAVRMLSMRLEASRPEMASHVREATAVITVAESQFVAKINGWFDGTMDRVSQNYTSYSRRWTIVVSLGVAMLLQLDALNIVNRLAIDDTLRAALVQAAPQTEPPAGAPAGSEELQARTKQNVEQLRLLASEKLVTLPTDSGWGANWRNASFLGILLSAGMLSLGAPFWYKILGEVLKMRPAMAAKDDQQRADRRSSQTVEAVVLPTGIKAAD